MTNETLARADAGNGLELLEAEALLLGGESEERHSILPVLEIYGYIGIVLPAHFFLGRETRRTDYRVAHLRLVVILHGRAISGAVASQLMVEAAFIPAGTVIVDNGALAIGALLFAICRMFEYGCILQKQDDELL